MLCASGFRGVLDMRAVAFSMSPVKCARLRTLFVGTGNDPPVGFGFIPRPLTAPGGV